MWKIVLDYKCGYFEGFVLIIYLVCMMDGVYKLMIYDSILSYVEVKLIKYLDNYKGLMKLIIYINNFFCVLCVKLLKEFLEIN